MTFSTEFESRLKTAGVKIPERIAFLPSNLADLQPEEQIFFSRQTPTLERVLRDAGVEVEEVVVADERVFLDARHDDLLLPLLFVRDIVVNSEPLVSVALNVISNYLYDWMNVTRKSRNVRMEIIREKADSYEHLKYEGPVEGLRVLEEWRPVGNDR